MFRELLERAERRQKIETTVHQLSKSFFICVIYVVAEDAVLKSATDLFFILVSGILLTVSWSHVLFWRHGLIEISMLSNLTSSTSQRVQIIRFLLRASATCPRYLSRASINSERNKKKRRIEI